MGLSFLLYLFPRMPFLVLGVFFGASLVIGQVIHALLSAVRPLASVCITFVRFVFCVTLLLS